MAFLWSLGGSGGSVRPAGALYPCLCKAWASGVFLLCYRVVRRFSARLLGHGLPVVAIRAGCIGSSRMAIQFPTGAGRCPSAALPAVSIPHDRH